VRIGGRNADPALSPDEATVAQREPREGISLYGADGGPAVPVKGVLDSEYPVRFAKGGKSLLVAEPTGRELVLTLVELAGGRRVPWKRFISEAHPDYRLVVVTPDLKYYAYQSPGFRLSSTS
jgi:hypothetical protein